jgi:hypothetical protein
VRTSRSALPAARRIALAALLLAASPAGAFDVPQSREEFVRAVREGARGAKVETIVVQRGFDEVLRTLETLASPCLDVTVERTAFVGYTEHSSSDYNPTLRKVGHDAAQFALQVVHNPRAIGENAPPGGLFVFAADLKRTGSAQTEVVLYRPTIGFKDITKQFVAWAEGRGTECPKLR